MCQWKYITTGHMIAEHSYRRYAINTAPSSLLSDAMVLTTEFEDLADLFMIDLFSYLSSIDVLRAFANLNHRFRKLVNERGFFRHINLSSAHLSKFDRILTVLALNQIETLVIDIGASSLQLTRWPHLPSLTTLRLYGLRDFEDATTFILQHSVTIIHLSLGTSDRFMSVGIIRDSLQTKYG